MPDKNKDATGEKKHTTFLNRILMFGKLQNNSKKKQSKRDYEIEKKLFTHFPDVSNINSGGQNNINHPIWRLGYTDGQHSQAPRDASEIIAACGEIYNEHAANYHKAYENKFTELNKNSHEFRLKISLWIGISMLLAVAIIVVAELFLTKNLVELAFSTNLSDLQSSSDQSLWTTVLNIGFAVGIALISLLFKYIWDILSENELNFTKNEYL